MAESEGRHENLRRKTGPRLVRQKRDASLPSIFVLVLGLLSDGVKFAECGLSFRHGHPQSLGDEL
jgi:hypothetical protein